MILVEIVEQLLVPLATATRLLLECLSVLTVLAGLLATASGAVVSLSRRLPRRPSNRARLSFGSWLALAGVLGALARQWQGCGAPGRCSRLQ